MPCLHPFRFGIMCFFFTTTTTTEFYTLSLHDALPIFDCHTSDSTESWENFARETPLKQTARRMLLMVDAINKQNFKGVRSDRKSTRLNSSHVAISYAVFCLKKKTPSKHRV